MNNMQQKILEWTLKYYPEQYNMLYQTAHLMEEFAECYKVLNKWNRGKLTKSEFNDQFAEEMGDVLFKIHQICNLVNMDVDRLLEYRYNLRLAQRQKADLMGSPREEYDVGNFPMESTLPVYPEDVREESDNDHHSNTAFPNKRISSIESPIKLSDYRYRKAYAEDDGVLYGEEPENRLTAAEELSWQEECNLAWKEWKSKGRPGSPYSHNEYDNQPEH